MENTFNPLTAMYRVQLEAARRVADAIFSGTEKIDRTVIGATREAMAEQYRFVQAFAGTRDGGASGLQPAAFGQPPANIASYQKEILGIVLEMQSEIGRSMQDCVDQWRQQALQGGPAAAYMASERPAGAGFNPMTGMLSVWESAFKDMTAMAASSQAHAGGNAFPMPKPFAAASAASSANASTPTSTGQAGSGKRK